MWGWKEREGKSGGGNGGGGTLPLEMDTALTTNALYGSSDFSGNGSFIVDCVPTDYGVVIAGPIKGTGLVKVGVAADELGLVARSASISVNNSDFAVRTFDSGQILRIPAGLPLGQPVTLRGFLQEVDATGAIIQTLAGAYIYPTMNVVSCAFI